MSSILNQHVLVLNRLWQAVNVCTARRALTLLFQGHAQAVLNRPDGSFQTFGFSEWHDLSQQEPDAESIRTVSFRIRIPRVILLIVYDHLPKKEVKFTRHNIFERDKNICQYCGSVFDRKDLNLEECEGSKSKKGGNARGMDLAKGCSKVCCIMSALSDRGLSSPQQ